MAELVFHLGFMKTGTSTIQATISRNRNRFKDRVWFRIRGGKTRRLRQLSAKFQRRNRDKDRDEMFAGLQAVGEEIAASGTAKALFSDETLVAIDYFNSKGPDYIASAERVMPMIVEAMPQHEISFVYYTREMAPWLKSSYKQFIYTRGMTETYEEWLARNSFPGDWPTIEARLVAATDKPVGFVPMESELGEGKVLGAALFRAVGFSDEEIAGFNVPELQNAGLSPGAVEFLRAANGSDYAEEKLWQIRKLVRQNPDCFR